MNKLSLAAQALPLLVCSLAGSGQDTGLAVPQDALASLKEYVQGRRPLSATDIENLVKVHPGPTARALLAATASDFSMSLEMESRLEAIAQPLARQLGEDWPRALLEHRAEVRKNTARQERLANAWRTIQQSLPGDEVFLPTALPNATSEFTARMTDAIATVRKDDHVCLAILAQLRWSRFLIEEADVVEYPRELLSRARNVLLNATQPLMAARCQSLLGRATVLWLLANAPGDEDQGTSVADRFTLFPVKQTEDWAATIGDFELQAEVKLAMAEQALYLGSFESILRSVREARESLSKTSPFFQDQQSFLGFQLNLRAGEGLKDKMILKEEITHLESARPQARWQGSDLSYSLELAYFKALADLLADHPDRALGRLSLFSPDVPIDRRTLPRHARDLAAKAVVLRLAALAASGNTEESARLADSFTTRLEQSFPGMDSMVPLDWLVESGREDSAQSLAFAMFERNERKPESSGFRFWAFQYFKASLAVAVKAKSIKILEGCWQGNERLINGLEMRLVATLRAPLVRSQRHSNRELNELSVEVAMALREHSNPAHSVEEQGQLDAKVLWAADRACRDTLFLELINEELSSNFAGSPATGDLAARIQKRLSEEKLSAEEKEKAFGFLAAAVLHSRGLSSLLGPDPALPSPDLASGIVDSREHLLYVIPSPKMLRLVHRRPNGSLWCGTVEVKEEKLLEILATVRQQLLGDSTDQRTHGPPPKLLEDWGNLSRWLLPPEVVGPLAAGESLLVVAPGDLSLFPLEALLTASVPRDPSPRWRDLPYLIAKVPVRRAPSLSLLGCLQRRGQREGKKPMSLAGLCVPDLQDPDLQPMLPFLEHLGTQWGKSNIQLGALASKEGFAQAAKQGGTGLLLIVAHGEAGRTAQARGIRLGATGSQDGFLSVPEIEAVRLPCDLAVLAVCGSAAGQVQAGETPYGVTYAFLKAGATATISGISSPPSRETAVVLSEVFAGQGQRSSRALAQAKLHLIQRGPEVGAHPRSWAGLVLTGLDPPIPAPRSSN